MRDIEIPSYHQTIRRVVDRWLVDLPGVNAQEKTREELIETLVSGAVDMLSLDVTVEPDGIMTAIDVPEPDWIR
jgi:hypothetical protein